MKRVVLVWVVLSIAQMGFVFCDAKTFDQSSVKVTDPAIKFSDKGELEAFLGVGYGLAAGNGITYRDETEALMYYYDDSVKAFMKGNRLAQSVDAAGLIQKEFFPYVHVLFDAKKKIVTGVAIQKLGDVDSNLKALSVFVGMLDKSIATTGLKRFAEKTVNKNVIDVMFWVSADGSRPKDHLIIARFSPAVGDMQMLTIVANKREKTSEKDATPETASQECDDVARKLAEQFAKCMAECDVEGMAALPNTRGAWSEAEKGKALVGLKSLFGNTKPTSKLTLKDSRKNARQYMIEWSDGKRRRGNYIVVKFVDGQWRVHEF